MPDETFRDSSSDAAPSSDPGPHKRSTTLRVIIWLLILGGFVILCWAILRHKPAANLARPGQRGFSGPVTLNVVTAHKLDLGVYLEAIGTVTPIHTDTVTSQATGLITAVHYGEGQMVRRGQDLIEIDSRPYQAQVLTAQGNLQRDMNLLAQAKMDLARYQAAWAKNSIARQTLQDQEKLVAQEEGAVKADHGVLALNQVQLSYCTIRAPISGRIGLRLVDPGNLVQANSGAPLAVITQVEPITVVFTIPEANVAAVEDQLRHGARLEVDAFDRDGQRKLAVGYLAAADNLIDTTTGTLKLRAVFNNKDHALFPNLFVDTRLLLNTVHDAVAIPASAIQQNGEESFVYLIQNGVAHVRDIHPGVTDRGMTQAQGLEEGDVVADSGFQKLQDGSKVTIAKKSLLPPSTHRQTSAP